MPVYMIRWPNGDVAFAMARNAEEARYRFDQFDEPLNLPIRRLRNDEFVLSLRLSDDFTFDVDHWGEKMLDAIEWAYPIVTKFQQADAESDKPNPGYDEALRKAVADERKRVEQVRDRGQQSFLDEYIARHRGKLPSKGDRAGFARMWGTTPEELAKWDERRRQLEVEHIPVRPTGKRRGRRGGGPH